MLTTIIFDQHQLLHRMRTVIKRYFLLHHQGPDFFSDFLNNAESELLQEVQLISRDRIQTLMNMASHFPSNEVNGHTADVLSFDFAPLSLIDHLDALHSISGGIKLSDTSKLQIQEDNNTRLTGIEAFMLDYHIETLPLSLIISQRSISNYQLIFRHLFFVKHVERRLFSVWLDHQTIKELQLRGELGETYCLRQQMLHFLQNLVYYMMFEVIEPRWHELEQNLSSSKTIDDMISHHEGFQNIVMKECLLTNHGLLKILAKLMSTCLLFSEQMKRFFDAAEIDIEFGATSTNARVRNQFSLQEANTDKEINSLGRKNRISSLSERLQHELKKTAYVDMISKFQRVFNSLLRDFREELEIDANTHYHSHLSNLGVRLDYNRYYSRDQ